MQNLFQALPSVDACLNCLEQTAPELYTVTPRSLLRDLVNLFLDTRRADIRMGGITSSEALHIERLLPALTAFVTHHAAPKFRRVLNGTGVIIHTNMGRSVLAREAVEAIVRTCSGYSNLELNLDTGKRGTRYAHVENLLCTLTGAEAALVVNNNAAAVLLTMNTLCSGKEVVVARSQLVEIGGSFRIPDVMERSGALLREVGCTNRVHPRDYEHAITENTAALMRVHTSNYRIIGFHSDVSLADLAAIAHAYGLLLIEDLGSGSLIDFSVNGLPGEPTVPAVIAAGADAVTFSGDKVLGGPQAGIIVGKKEIIARIKSNPLNRALRIDKMTLAALEATLRLYLDETNARLKIPTVAMMTETQARLHQKATHLAKCLRQSCGAKVHIELITGESRVGGGAFPETGLPTTLLRINPQICTAQELKTRLLSASIPLIGRLENQAFILDPRTLTDEEFSTVAAVIAEALAANTDNRELS